MRSESGPTTDDKVWPPAPSAEPVDTPAPRGHAGADLRWILIPATAATIFAIYALWYYDLTASILVRPAWLTGLPFDDFAWTLTLGFMVSTTLVGTAFGFAARRLANHPVKTIVTSGAFPLIVSVLLYECSRGLSDGPPAPFLKLTGLMVILTVTSALFVFCVLGRSGIDDGHT